MRIGLLNAIVSFFACTLFFVCLSVHKCALLPYLVNAVWGLTHVGPGNHVLDGDPGPKGRALLRGHVLAHCNVRASTLRVHCACTAHVADECIRHHDTIRYDTVE